MRHDAISTDNEQRVKKMKKEKREVKLDGEILLFHFSSSIIFALSKDQPPKWKLEKVISIIKSNPVKGIFFITDLRIL